MKKVLTILFSAFLLVPAFNYAQDGAEAYEGGHSLTFNDNVIEIGGFTTFFYQMRPKYTGDTKNSSNNVFTVDDARVSLRGWIKGKLMFHFEYNFAALGAWLGVDPTTAGGQAAAPTSSPKDQPLTECHFTYRTPWLDIKVGYMKIPYGLLNLEDKIGSAYQERWKFGNGDYDPRRDAGFMLDKTFWHKHIDLSAGIFSGMGENIIYGVQDPSGRFEYCGRAEFSNIPIKWEEWDRNNRAKPVFRLGLNAKEDDKTQFSGNGTLTWDANAENVRTIDGEKFCYGGDATIFWHGFNVIAEWTRDEMTPHNDGNGLQLLLEQESAVSHKQVNHLFDGGWYVTGGYYYSPFRSGVAVRYDMYNLEENITIQGSPNHKDRTCTFAYIFNIPKTYLQFKFDYAYRIPLPGGAGPSAHWAEDEMRVGFQYQF